MRSLPTTCNGHRTIAGVSLPFPVQPTAAKRTCSVWKNRFPCWAGSRLWKWQIALPEAAATAHIIHGVPIAHFGCPASRSTMMMPLATMIRAPTMVETANRSPQMSQPSAAAQISAV